mmetsp:Transcript_8880/g.19215  ORF Transcript_8880/g.19215 Transcript_8880/m.19215 type:complete len:776 (-) Transcript_8880:14-2341(-)
MHPAGCSGRRQRQSSDTLRRQRPAPSQCAAQRLNAQAQCVDGADLLPGRSPRHAVCNVRIPAVSRLIARHMLLTTLLFVAVHFPGLTCAAVAASTHWRGPAASHGRGLADTRWRGPAAPPRRISMARMGASSKGKATARSDASAIEAELNLALRRRLYVGNLPFGMNEAEVARIFDGVALPHEVRPVLEVSLMLRQDGAPRGDAFVQLATSVQARRAALLLDGRQVEYGGRSRALTVRPARPTAPRPAATNVTADGANNAATTNSPDSASATRQLAKPAAGRVLHVTNLSFEVGPVEIRNAFAAAAEVPEQTVWCSLARGRAGRSSGYGTVRFDDAESASLALSRMHESTFWNRTLGVSIDWRVGPALDLAASGSGKGGGATGGGANGGKNGSVWVQPPAGDSRPLVDGIDDDVAAVAEAHLLAEEREARRLEQITRHKRVLSAAAAAAAAVERANALARRQRCRRSPNNEQAPECFVVLGNLPLAMRANAVEKEIRALLRAKGLEEQSQTVGANSTEGPADADADAAGGADAVADAQAQAASGNNEASADAAAFEDESEVAKESVSALAISTDGSAVSVDAATFSTGISVNATARPLGTAEDTGQNTSADAGGNQPAARVQGADDVADGGDDVDDYDCDYDDVVIVDGGEAEADQADSNTTTRIMRAPRRRFRRASAETAAASPSRQSRRIWVQSDRFGRSSGFGLVWAHSAKDARKVLQALDGYELGGRALVCRLNQTSANSFPRLRPITWLRTLEKLDGNVSQTAHAYGRAW